MVTLSVNKNDRILVVAPHPDDECIGAGGLLKKYSKQCDVWLLTDGSQGRNSEQSPYDIKQIRKPEFFKEMAELDIVHYRMFNIEDGTLSQHLDCLNNEALSVYTKIFVTNKNDSHLDHRAAYNIVKNALQYQKLQNIEMYQYEINAPLSQVSHFINMGNNIESKKFLMELHQSQITILNYSEMAVYLNKYRAASFGLQDSYIETYLLSDINESVDEYIMNIEQKQQKQKHITNVYDMWLTININGKSILEYFEKRNIKEIAIYGYGGLGKRLYQELKQQERVKVKYIIDQMAQQKRECKENIIPLSENMEKVDCIVVTAVHDYDEIKENLLNIGYDNVISLEKILDELM